MVVYNVLVGSELSGHGLLYVFHVGNFGFGGKCGVRVRIQYTPQPSRDDESDELLEALKVAVGEAEMEAGVSVLVLHFRICPKLQKKLESVVEVVHATEMGRRPHKAPPAVVEPAVGEFLQKVVQSLQMMVHNGHVEHREVIERNQVNVEVAGFRHEQQKMKAHQIVAVEGCIMEIAPAVVLRVNVEPEFGKTRKKSFCDGKVSLDDSASEAGRGF